MHSSILPSNHFCLFLWLCFGGPRFSKAASPFDCYLDRLGSSDRRGLYLLGEEMAENSQGDQAAAAVQILRELPSIYRWVTNDILGTPSSLDQQYLDELKLTGVLFGGGDLE
ncbi:hypothetical protein PIB30_060770 [Stylosanthes scabra]|uniref:Uncharacterized protein n=1 Tax=Stylosanthes scabra TaxID=79078 RepID=A0ABU6QL47_9FABA|nr:hypothetical protein [Stylosanthes scabra]